MAHLEAENEYTQAQTAHLADLRQSIFDEIKARTRETDLSVPTRNRGHWYYGRSFEGKEYGASCRVPVTDPDDWTPPRPAEDSAPDQPALPGEELLLDLDALAEGHEFFSLGGSSVSPDGTLLAYSTDVVGDERYTIRVLDLATREHRPDEIVGVIGGATWDPSGEHLYYTTVDESWRSDKIWRHTLGTAQADDELVHHEEDGRFFVGVGRSRSDRFVIVAAGSKITSEYRFLDSRDPDAGFQRVQPAHGRVWSTPSTTRSSAARTSSSCCTTTPARTSRSAPRPSRPPPPRTGRRWSPTTRPSGSRTSTRSPAISSCTSAARG